jgi:inhibitor of KinA
LLNQLTYKSFGENAILIEWPSVISEEILRDIVEYKTKIERLLKLQDVIVGYNSLLLVYNFQIENYNSKIDFLKELYIQKGISSNIKGTHWEIPVCYDMEFGMDLKRLSKEKKCSVDQIIQLHSETIYTVFFVGFLPGFLYLGGLNSELYSPRKATPRLRVPKGAVAIGGEQTGVYPNESSGGWNIIGNSPISFFDIDKIAPCFAKTGDKITFKSISLKEYKEIEEAVNNNEYQMQLVI